MRSTLLAPCRQAFDGPEGLLDHIATTGDRLSVGLFLCIEDEVEELYTLREHIIILRRQLQATLAHIESDPNTHREQEVLREAINALEELHKELTSFPSHRPERINTLAQSSITLSRWHVKLQCLKIVCPEHVTGSIHTNRINQYLQW